MGNKTNRYSVMVQWSEADNGFIATVPELPGLSAFGKTAAKAVDELSVAQKLYIETMKEDGEELPEPEMLNEYSGQFRVRIPKSLHQSLSTEARKEGVSLNTYVVALLSEKNSLNQIRRELAVYKTAALSANIVLGATTWWEGNYVMPTGSTTHISSNVASTIRTITHGEGWQGEGDPKETNLH